MLQNFQRHCHFFSNSILLCALFYWSDMNNFYEAFHVKFVILSIQKAFTRFHCIFVHFCTLNVEIKFLENRDFSMCFITRIRVRKLLKMTYLLTSFYKNAQGFKLGIKRILKEEILSFHLMQKNCCQTQKSGPPLKSPSSSRLNITSKYPFFSAIKYQIIFRGGYHSPSLPPSINVEVFIA